MFVLLSRIRIMCIKKKKMEVAVAPVKELQTNIIENSSASTVTDLHKGLTLIN